MNQTRLPKALAALGILGLTCMDAEAFAQKPDAVVVLNRMSSAYRGLQSYRDSSTLTQKAGDKTYTADVKLAVQRPNRFMLDIKGEKYNTQVWSDGTSLVAYRPDRKAYTKTKAPALLMKADVLAKIDVPTPGSKLIAFLLQNTLRTSDDPLAKSMREAEAAGPLYFGSKMAYVLTFRYDQDYDAKVYVTDNDFLIRKVSLVRGGDPELIQTFNEIEIDKPIANDAFASTLPDGARVVFSLPPLERVVVAAAGPPAPDFKLQTYKGDTVRLSDLKGKVVLVNFFFNN